MKGILVRLGLSLIFLFSSQSILSTPIYWHYYQLDFAGLGNCGPACVAMVYTYHTGDLIHLKEVQKHIPVRSKDGSSTLQGLSHALKGLEIPNEIVDLPEVDNKSFYNKDFMFSEYLYIINIDTKFILNKEYSYEGGHYVVAFDYFDGYYKIADPLHKEDVVWYYGEDLIKALKYDKVIRVERWKNNKEMHNETECF